MSRAAVKKHKTIEYEAKSVIVDEQEAALEYLAQILVEAYFKQKGYERTKHP